jgi:hypothetical protein
MTTASNLDGMGFNVFFFRKKRIMASDDNVSELYFDFASL